MTKICKLFVFVFICFGVIFMLSCSSNNKEDNKKIVRYVIDEKVIKEEKVELDAVVNEPEIDANYYIEYSWDLNTKEEDGVKVEEYVLNYQLKKFTVSYYDGNTLLKKDTLDALTLVNLDAYNKDGYDFIGWFSDSELQNQVNELKLTESVKLYAKYVKAYCSIKYYDGSELISEDNVRIGTTINTTGYSKAGYEFIGWFLSDLSYTPINTLVVKDDIKLYARFLEVVKHDLLVLPNATKHITSTKVVTTSYGTTVYQPVIPSGAPSSSATDYDWTSSDTNIATISQWSSMSIVNAGYCIITGTLKSDNKKTINCIIHTSKDGITVSSEAEANLINVFTITFVGKDNEVISTAKATDTSNVLYPTPLHYDGYTFIGWDRENYGFTRDTTIKALYKEGSGVEKLGESFAIIGDSISTYKGIIPDGYACFYPYPTADVTNFNQTWWMRTINKVGGYLLINESYSGSCVNAGSSSDSMNYSRINNLKISGVQPDNIIIYMGSNDCASQYVSVNQFITGYKTMIERIKEVCPDSKIYLCTLATSTKFYTTSSQEEFNAVIRQYAEEFNLTLIEMKDVNITNNLVDSAHPNSAGMEIFANGVIAGLLQ